MLSRVLMSLLVLAVAAGVAACQTSEVKTEPDEAGAPADAEATDAQTSEDGSEGGAQSATVGDSITLAGNDDALTMKVTVIEVRNPAKGTDIFKPEKGNKFVGVRIRLENVGDVVYDDSPSNGAALVTRSDENFNAQVFDILSPAIGSPKIKPGDKRVGWLTFEVPKKAKLRTFQFTLDSGFGPQTGEWALTK